MVNARNILDPGGVTKKTGNFFFGGGIEDLFGLPTPADLLGKTAADQAAAQQQNAIAAAAQLRNIQFPQINLPGSNLATIQALNAGQIAGNVNPLRSGLINQSLNALGIPSKGNPNPTGLGGSPQFSAYKATLEDQFKRAKDNVMGSTASGGQLMDQLAGIETQRALGLAQGAGDIYGKEVDRAMQLLQSQGALGQQGLQTAASQDIQQLLAQGNLDLAQQGNQLTQASNAAQIQAGLAGNLSQSSAQQKAGVGQGLGSMLGKVATKGAV